MSHQPSQATRLNPQLELTKMRLREFLREPGILFWVFAFPLLMAFGLGVAFRSKPAEKPHVAVVRGGNQPLTEALLRSPRLASEVKDEAEARRDLARSKIDVIVKFDHGNPSYIFDSTQEKGPTARLVVDDVLQRAAGRADPLPVREVTASAPGSRYIDFLLPGLVGMNLMGTSMWGVGYNLVVARKRRLLRRFAVTPMRRPQFLMSYFYARSLFLLLEIGMLLLFGYFVFGTIIRGSIASYFAMGILGAASFAGISLLIGARVENTESANGWMNLVQLPMWVLSGAFFSYERFPTWLHGIIRALPLTALNDGLRAIANDGLSLAATWPQIGVLVAWGLIGFFIALRTFRWQ
jgi:ABC-type multidrug transport system permease subunit